MPCSHTSPVMRNGRLGGVEPISDVLSAASAYNRVAADERAVRQGPVRRMQKGRNARGARGRTARADAPPRTACPQRVEQLGDAGQPLDALAAGLVQSPPRVGNLELELTNRLGELGLVERVAGHGYGLEALDIVLGAHACVRGRGEVSAVRGSEGEEEDEERALEGARRDAPCECWKNSEGCMPWRWHQSPSAFSTCRRAIGR